MTKQQDTQEKSLADCLQVFQEQDKPFLYNKTFRDDDGFTAHMLADWSVESMKDGAYYIINVSAHEDDQPSNATDDEIYESEAFQKAITYVQEAIQQGLEHVQGNGNYERHDRDVSGYDGVEAGFTVIYNFKNMN